jgi:hypothetical protein
MQASPASPPVSSSLYHARLAPKRTDKHGEARASRDHLSVGDVALELAVMSRAGAARASIDVHAKVPSAGAGATRCAMLGPDQLSTTAKRVVALKTCAASKLFRRSGVVMAASAWVLARRGRCGPCIALMTKKVDKTFHEREIWAVKKLARRALSLLLALTSTARWFRWYIHVARVCTVVRSETASRPDATTKTRTPCAHSAAPN